jgi:hypothetical protein
MHPDWLIPKWPAPGPVRAVCTTRAGGMSAAPYDTLNLGDHVGDRLPDVAANRAILQQAMNAQPVFLSQVHGAHAVWLSDSTAQGTQADGSLTGQPRLACTIMVADCLPVLFANAQGSLGGGARGLARPGGAGRAGNPGGGGGVFQGRRPVGQVAGCFENNSVVGPLHRPPGV